MDASRRDFIQRSATAAAALTLTPGVASPATREPAVAPGDPAAIRALEARLMRAKPVALSRVRVTGGPLKRAQELTAKYLLELEPDRMLSYYRIRASLPKKAEPYDGWDGDGRNLTGHITGHHLSAVSLMYRATGDVRFKQRADYLVAELRQVQEKNGDGYLGAIAGLREAFAAVSRGDIRSNSGFDLNGLWSPWYTLHKTYAGLRDAYRHTGNRTALAMETRFAEWAEGVLAPMNEAQLARMLNVEHGGMNEVLADLYADTGDARWLRLSQRFEHHEFTEALKRHQDNLNGKHGNCQIPKLIGSATRYGYTADAADLLAASFFWDRVVQHHTYATGGHGLAEYFGAPDMLSARVDGRTCETCNEYNMLKLTRRLFSFRPDAFHADFAERALFNHILASIDPEDGRTSYMVPVGRGVQQEYQRMLEDFTCCVGTGMESHALHGDGIYYESDDTVWVNLFVPSTAELSGGRRMTMATDFPEGDSAAITLALPSPKAFTLAVRRPSWAGDGFRIRVNGEVMEQPSLASLRAGSAGGRAIAADDRVPQPSTFVELQRTWKTGDRVEITIPKSLRLEPTADNPSVAAIMWGPLVLAGDLGPRREGRGGAAGGAVAPVLVAAGKPLTEWVVPAGTRAGDFKAQQVGRMLSDPSTPTDVALAPFYRTHRRRYSAYFDVFTPGQFESRAAALATERERVRRMEAATVGFVQAGEIQPDKDYNYQSDRADRQVGRAEGRTNRGGAGWFSYDMPVDGAGETTLVITHLNELGLPPATGNFQVLVDGTAMGRFQPDASAVGFYDVTYALPMTLTRGKSKVTVRFEAAPDGRIAPVFGVRTVRTREL